MASDEMNILKSILCIIARKATVNSGLNITLSVDMTEHWNRNRNMNQSKR